MRWHFVSSTYKLHHLNPPNLAESIQLFASDDDETKKCLDKLWIEVEVRVSPEETDPQPQA